MPIEISENLRQQIEIMMKVLLAMFLGGVLGFEREQKGKAAGLRTMILVAGSATLIVGLAKVTVANFMASFPGRPINSDPIRAFEAIIVGISFIGSGMIIQRREQGTVEGLTTAATLLSVAGIGASVAEGQYLVAIAVTWLVWVVLHVLSRLEKHTGS